MKMQIVIAVVISICLGIFSNTFAASQGGGNIFVMNLVGSGDMYPSKVPDIDGDGEEDDAICFDVNLLNSKNGHLIGTATDCLSNITPVGTGLALIGTTYFNLPQGMLITRGNTTVQPVTQNIVTANNQLITHITGAASTENAILSATGRFAGQTGTVRLSGMVDMTNFAGAIGDPMAFDCLFIITFD